jgi:hypothetical protein
MARGLACTVVGCCCCCQCCCLPKVLHRARGGQLLDDDCLRDIEGQVTNCGDAVIRKYGRPGRQIRGMRRGTPTIDGGRRSRHLASTMRNY